MADVRFIPYPKEVEERENKLREMYGDCYDCKNHRESCRVCGKTGCHLVYPIRDCPGHLARIDRLVEV